MRKRLRIRSLPALAVVLPLGAGAPAAERPPIPQEIVRDPAATAAVGGVLHSGESPYACAGVLVRSAGEARSRRGAPGPGPIASLGRLGAGAGAGSTRTDGGGETLLELHPASTAAPPGFELWEGCARLPDHLKEGRLQLLVAGADPDGATGERRITAVEVRPEIWTWRPVRAPARGGGGESAADDSAPLERGRGAAPLPGDS